MQHLLVSDSVPPWMKSSTVVEAMAKGPSHWDLRKSWENHGRYGSKMDKNHGKKHVFPMT
jgi:hypothetical protein